MVCRQHAILYVGVGPFTWNSSDLQAVEAYLKSSKALPVNVKVMSAAHRPCALSMHAFLEPVRFVHVVGSHVHQACVHVSIVCLVLVATLRMQMACTDWRMCYA